MLKETTQCVADAAGGQVQEIGYQTAQGSIDVRATRYVKSTGSSRVIDGCLQVPERHYSPVHVLRRRMHVT